MVAVDADVDDGEVGALAFLLDTDYVLIVFGAGFQLGHRTILFLIFVASEFVLPLVLVDITYYHVIRLVVGAAFEDLVAELLQFVAIEVENLLRRIIGLVLYRNNFQAEGRRVDNDVAAVVVTLFL